MHMETLYDRSGSAIAYIHDDGMSVYLYDGKPVAWIDGDSMYAYSGAHIGWFESGWVRDHSGRCVLFCAHATGGGPARPARHARPARGARQARPARGARRARPARAARSSSWSHLTGTCFFTQ